MKIGLDDLQVETLGMRVLGAGLVLTWLVPHHPLPMTSFYHEWLFALFSCLGAGLLFFSARKQSVELWGAFPAICGVMLLALSVQAWGHPESVFRVACVAGYMFLALMLYFLGQTIRSLDPERGICLCATAILAGALGSALVGALQLSGRELVGFTVPRVNPSIYGNLGQANHFSDLMWLGCASAAVLYSLRKMSLALFLSAISALLFFSVCSSSRGAWVDSVMFLIAGVFLWLGNQKGHGVRRFGLGLFLISVAFPLVYVAATRCGVLDFFSITESTGRMLGDAKGNSLRLWLWGAGLSAALSHPLLGIGPGAFGGYSLQHAMLAPPGVSLGVDVNSHNLFLQIAAEFGFPVALLVAVLLLCWGVGLVRRREDLGSAMALSAALILGARSMFEFPLWYAQYLGVLAIFAGLAVIPSGKIQVHVARVLPLPVIGIALLCVAYAHERPLERSMLEFAFQVSVGGEPALSENIRSDLDSVPHWSPFRPYAEAISVMAELPGSPVQAQGLLSACERSVKLVPSVYVLSRCSAIASLAGSGQLATRLGESVCRVYPTKINELAASLRLISMKSGFNLRPRISCVRFD